MLLHEWQTGLQRFILDPDNSALMDKLQKVTSKTEFETRLAIYTDAYRLRLSEALRANYPALHQLLGDDDFAVLAERFIAENPPKTASIRWFGDCLPVFLAEKNPYQLQPVFAELAKFEWALRHTVDAADADRLTLDDLQILPPEQWAGLRFSHHSSLSILALDWNTPHIWQALTNQQSPPAPQQHTSDWIIYRQPDLSGAWRSISAVEVAALQFVAKGHDFSELCEFLLEWVEDTEQVPPLAAGFLRGWVESGLLVAIVIRENDS